MVIPLSIQDFLPLPPPYLLPASSHPLIGQGRSAVSFHSGLLFRHLDVLILVVSLLSPSRQLRVAAGWVLIPRENDFTLPLYPRRVCTSYDAIAITRRARRWFLDIRRALCSSLRFEGLPSFCIRRRIWTPECDLNVGGLSSRVNSRCERASTSLDTKIFDVRNEGKNKSSSLHFKPSVTHISYKTKYSVAKTARMNMQYPQASARASAAPTMKPFVTEARPASILRVNRQRQSGPKSRFPALSEDPNRPTSGDRR